MFDDALFVEWENFGIFFGKPDRGRGGGRGQDDLDSRPAHDVHHPLEPAEIVFAILRFAQAPGEVTYADDINAGLNHELGILFPLRFGILGCSSVRKYPLFRIIIDAKIHILVARTALGRTVRTSSDRCNAKVEP